MAHFSKGDSLIYSDAGAVERPAVVLGTVNDGGTLKAVLRVLSPNFCDDYIVGPNPDGGWSQDPTPVSVDGSGNPSTAALSPAAQTVATLRDGAFLVPCSDYQSAAWSRSSPVSTRFVTSTPDEDLWLQLPTTTDLTEFDVEVKHNADGSTILVEIYRTTAIGVVSGPDAAYASDIKAAWSWTSTPGDAAWQSHTFSIGSVYPGPLAPRFWTVRFKSGPNIPGLQLFECRNVTARAAEITV